MNDNKPIKIVEYYSHGFRSTEIGQKLGISGRTVEKHIELLRAKNGCKTIPHLVAKFLREKIIE